MKPPRLIYYNDAHHFHAKRIDPPLSTRKLRWPADEVVGTGVELLVLGLGYGDVYFHNSSVGRVVGQEKEVWENIIDWRIMRMVKDAAAMGTDQVREVIKRGGEIGMAVFPSLKLQAANSPEGQRCGWLKWKHGADVCLGDGEEEPWCYDYTNELVVQDKLAMITEMLDDYQADGIELDFMFRPRYFRGAEIERGTPLMSKFVARVRELTKEIGTRQGREIPVLARVAYGRDDNLKIGLDVETWLKEGSIDMVAGEVRDSLLDTCLVDARWMADAANAAGAAAYLRPPGLVYDERTATPHVEMYRALGQTLHWQGFAGMYLGYLPWPLSQTEYQILREVAYPDVVARQDKRYVLQPREPGDAYSSAPTRQLPGPLEEGKTVSVVILVSDDLDDAKRDGEMREPILTIRFANLCIEDEIEIRFNGEVLPIKDAQVTDNRGTRIMAANRITQLGGAVDAPDGFTAHWFRYSLEVEMLKRGENTLEVEVKKLDETAGFARSVNGVEVQTRYKDFVRPQGLEVERVSTL